MLSYALRRILLMIPTFIGILIINFAILRLQGPTLVEQMQAGGGNQPGMASSGDRKVQGAAKNVENYIDRFRRSGIDLPALVNVRGWYTKEDYVGWIRKTIANGVYYKTPSKRNKLEKELWLSGPQGIPPLLAILQDETLAEIHAPTAQALSYSGYVTLTPRDLQHMSGVEIQRIQQRNQTLRDNRIFFNNTREQGIEVVDEEAEKKRRTLIALFSDPVNVAEYKERAGSAMSALFLKTGFWDFITKLFTGELYSESRKEYVFTVIEDRWAVTFWLNSIAILIAWVISVPLGIRSARRINSLEDRTTTTALFLAWSMPSMFLGTLLLYHLCTDTAGGKALFPNRGLSSDNSLWMPTGAYILDLIWHAALPLVVLSYASFTALSRYMRANLLEQLDADYVRTARAKGCSDDTVVYGHATRNSLITMITLGSGLLAELFSGALIVELIFSIPGLGWLMLDAALQQDGPLLMGSTIISVSLLLFGILIADLLYAVADPRIRSRYG